VNQLRQMRAIITSALVWSGVLILVVGLACAVALSVRPLRRLRILQSAGQEIAAGDLKRRMPVSERRDELDMFAGTVNYMMDEVERLMSEVKGATDTIAHDLRTPLAHARAQLTRLQQAPERKPEDIARVIGEIDVVLERFRALLRISELEARGRHAGFVQTDLAQVLGQVVELYQPLADEQQVRLSLSSAGPAVVEADPKLLFEAISNLVDNAIKFTGPGGSVELALQDGPAIVVRDNGPGIAAGERAAVLQRFYRSERSRQVPGSGLGLTSVAAILRMHRFALELQDANPGLRAIIRCRPSILPG
jgi:signal transduction histidine kinase